MLLWGAQLPAQSSPQVSIRNDLGKLVNDHLCSSQKLPTRSDFWSKELFDTSIEIQTMTPKNQASINLDQLKKAAQILASQQSHLGYDYGICSNGSAWTVSVPSPKNLIQKEGDKLQFDLAPLKNQCRAIRIDFAAVDKNETRNLFRWPKHDVFAPIANVNSKFLRPGTLSLTCYPTNNAKGPVLWSLLPVHTLNLKLPWATVLEDDPESLKKWVNQLRKLEGLAPLEDRLEPLDSSGLRLSKVMTVAHDRRLLKKEKKRLQEKQIFLIGENRVQGKNTSEMAWLLWNSPRHRKLLFNPSATHFTLGTQKRKGKALAVMVFARTQKH